MKNNDQTFGRKQPAGSWANIRCTLRISLLVAAVLYNIVDQIFIANAAYLGSTATPQTLSCSR